jgi:hypothetical protein
MIYIELGIVSGLVILNGLLAMAERPSCPPGQRACARS